MTNVRIYKPAKAAMQSGHGNTHEWVLEPAAASAVSVDPLMGWSGSANTAKQVTLRFPSKEDAVRYAEANGMAFTVSEAPARKPTRRSYADNFKFGRIGSWTH
ncbi:MAG: ETC complex I subunit [Hyphomicrobiaceae bacterium]